MMSLPRLLLFLASGFLLSSLLLACPAPVAEPFGPCRAADGDVYEFNSAEVNGDTLTANLSFSGGCEQHEFTLCWPDQQFGETDDGQTQVTLEIFHDANDDSCEAYLTEDVDLDLADLEVAYIGAFGPGPGSMVILLGGEILDFSF